MTGCLRPRARNQQPQTQDLTITAGDVEGTCRPAEQVGQANTRAGTCHVADELQEFGALGECPCISCCDQAEQTGRLQTIHSLETDSTFGQHDAAHSGCGHAVEQRDSCGLGLTPVNSLKHRGSHVLAKYGCRVLK